MQNKTIIYLFVLRLIELITNSLNLLLGSVTLKSIYKDTDSTTSVSCVFNSTLSI